MYLPLFLPLRAEIRANYLSERQVAFRRVINPRRLRAKYTPRTNLWFILRVFRTTKINMAARGSLYFLLSICHISFPLNPQCRYTLSGFVILSHSHETVAKFAKLLIVFKALQISPEAIPLLLYSGST